MCRLDFSIVIEGLNSINVGLIFEHVKAISVNSLCISNLRIKSEWLQYFELNSPYFAVAENLIKMEFPPDRILFCILQAKLPFCTLRTRKQSQLQLQWFLNSKKGYQDLENDNLQGNCVLSCAFEAYYALLDNHVLHPK